VIFERDSSPRNAKTPPELNLISGYAKELPLFYAKRFKPTSFVFKLNTPQISFWTFDPEKRTLRHAFFKAGFV
jgi:hypothetical protein